MVPLAGGHTKAFLLLGATLSSTPHLLYALPTTKLPLTGGRTDIKVLPPLRSAHQGKPAAKASPCLRPTCRWLCRGQGMLHAYLLPKTPPAEGHPTVKTISK